MEGGAPSRHEAENAARLGAAFARHRGATVPAPVPEVRRHSRSHCLSACHVIARTRRRVHAASGEGAQLDIAAACVQLSGQRILTMEYVDGCRLTDIACLHGVRFLRCTAMLQQPCFLSAVADACSRSPASLITIACASTSLLTTFAGGSRHAHPAS